MSEPKFTPGPWRYVSADEQIVASNGNTIVWETGSNRFDAHLIAAAPELYELVYESLYHLRLDDGAKGYHERALAMLRKARGEQ